MNYVLAAFVVISICLLVYFLRTFWYQERPSKETERTISATVTSKEIRRGTHRSGRSNGGYSYIVHFLTTDSQTLELFAYEIEYGSLNEGMKGLVTYKGRYFVSFQSDIST